MPDRDYYTSDAPAMRQARTAYRDYLIRMLKVAGVAEPDSIADAVSRLETAIAAIQWSASDSRDAARTYNPVAVSSLDTGRSRFRVAPLVRALGYRTARVIVRQPDAVAATLRLIDAAPVATLRAMVRRGALSKSLGVCSMRLLKLRSFTYAGCRIRRAHRAAATAVLPLPRRAGRPRL